MLRIGTYNLRNLFLDPASIDLGGTRKKSKALRSLARVVDSLDVDLWILQEVGSAISLGLLNDKLRKPYPVVELIPGNSDRSIHLGVLSRLEVHLTSHTHVRIKDEEGVVLCGYQGRKAARLGSRQPLGFSRDVLRVEFAHHRVPFALFGVHLKSMTQPPWQDLPASRIRAAEVRALVTLIQDYQQRHPSVRILVGGDFNDLSGAEALGPLESLGYTDLHARAVTVGEEEATTYWPRKAMRLDRLLLSPETARLAVANSACIHAGDRQRLASDHYPVTIDLALGADGVEDDH